MPTLCKGRNSILWRLCEHCQLDSWLGKLEAEAEAGGDGQAELLYRCCGRGVFLVEEVFYGGEELDAGTDAVRGHGVEHKEAAERKLILVVVELFADHAAEHGNVNARRIGVACLKGENVARHLRHPQSYEGCIRGE